jgi:UDP-N-acetyl-alpha-D-muramoyl-L-alanyl-L-glutamate epimerase
MILVQLLLYIIPFFRLNRNDMKPERFVFESYQFRPEKGEISFKYSLDGDIEFEEVLVLPERAVLQVEEGLLERLLFNLHLIVGISYYKTYCPGEIQVKSGVLSREEADFWNKLYTQGLGEFFYQNKIDFTGLVKFPFEEVEGRSFRVELEERSLLPLGGGKDSIVAAEMLREKGKDFEIFNLGGYEVAGKIAKEMGKEPIVVKRSLSEELFRLNKEGALNGHVPISAYLAFLSVFLGVIYGFKYVVLANERSANEGNVEFEGMEVNHQYSKSFEFEEDFSDYLKRFVTPGVKYFSLLRPYYEIEIAKRFAEYPQYFDIFTSCNKNFKVKGAEKGWCCDCAKCAFVYAILSPFVEKEKLVAMFGEDLFEKESLKGIFAELRGETEVKPFDCVGTPEEVRYAVKGGDAEDLFDFHGEHGIPLSFLKTVVIGYGKEGKAVKAFLGEVDVRDMKDGDGYLDGLGQYEAIVKSPGVPWLPEIVAVKDRVTSGTQMFFDELDPSNIVIGVTGSKGKSTTASLIYEVLKAAGENVILVGNIGEAALSHVDVKDSIVVMELSSYQLDGLKARVDVAVWTSFFPEHLNVHGDMEKYLEAKAGLVKNLREEDVFVYHQKDGESLNNLTTAAQRIVLGDLPEIEMKLVGQHNLENVALAVTVGTILGVEKSVIEKVVKDFDGLPHRLQEIGIFKGICFVDDAISTTPESTIAALKVFDGEVGTVFLGGEDRGYNFKELGKSLKGVKNVVLFPDSGVEIRKYLGDVKILETDSMEEAVKFAYENTPKGRVCLLSTASPSYSVWKNFEEKGDEFQKWVREL